MLTTIKSYKNYLLILAFISALGIFNLTQSVQTSATYLGEVLSGRILLQVEEHGEAWYVNPADHTRIYLRNGLVAYDVMRNLSLGITNEDLAKIPIGLNTNFACIDNDGDGLCNKLEEVLKTDINDADTDHDGYIDSIEIVNNYNPLSPAAIKIGYQPSLVNRLKGKILLQVQEKGQAWYVNPADGRRYYMTDGQTAYQMMRYLSLGITNDNLDQIPISSYIVDESQYANLAYGGPSDENEETEIPGETDENQETDPADQAVCGNHRLESGEQCDSSAPVGYLCNNQCQLVKILSPQAQANCPTYLLVGQAGSFDAGDSSDPQNLALSYTWDFDDGYIITPTTNITAHSFQNTGQYEIELTASNGSLEDTDTCLTIVGENSSPEPEPESVCGNNQSESGEECDGTSGVLEGYYCTDQCQLVEIVTYVDGEDYTLPDEVSSEDFSGYVCSSCSNAQSGSLWLGWIDFEPTRGVYDWTALENGLASLTAQGKTGSLHLQSIVVGGYDPESDISVDSQVPSWVFKYYGLDWQNLPLVGDAFNITVIPQWWPDIRTDFNNMVTALGEAYADDPRLESIYLHGISNSRGEELWMTQPYLDDIEADWGLTPTVMYDWLSSRMDAYAIGFAGEENKVAWVGSAPAYFQARSDFQQVSTDLMYYAWDKDFGNRNGGIESYLWNLEQLAWGSTVDSNGYIIIDETSPNFDGRYWGEENEEYGSSWEWRFGSYYSDPYRYRMSIMRALQARMRWLWTSEAAEDINPSLSEYARLSFGKDINNSPDAWALLFSSSVNPQYYGVNQINNFERWLIQRDVAGGMTVPTMLYYKGFDTGAGSYYDYTARRTDTDSGNNYIYFALDDDFIPSDIVQIKVEIVDNSGTDWHLEYYEAGGVLAATPIISNSLDGQVKTYTMTINDANFANQFNSNMDFRLVNDGPGNLTVRWVRLVRGNDF